MKGLYFDGRKDQTLVIEKINNKNYRKIINEEHYVIVSQPDNEYAEHLAPLGSKAVDVGQSIFNYIEESGQVENISVVGCDSTNVNTGNKNGVITYLEKKFYQVGCWSF